MHRIASYAQDGGSMRTDVYIVPAPPDGSKRCYFWLRIWDANQPMKTINQWRYESRELADQAARHACN